MRLQRQETDNRGFRVGLPWQVQALRTAPCEVVTNHWFKVLKLAVLRAPKAIINPGMTSKRATIWSDLGHQVDCILFYLVGSFHNADVNRKIILRGQQSYHSRA
jgi:hypothetical protein